MGRYDPWLVALSVTIAVLAAGAALDLASRVRAARGMIEALWLAGGAVALGLGIWCMHYTGMLAFGLPVSVYYHVPTVGLSLVAAVLASVVALYVGSRPQLDLGRLAAGSVVMGAGIATMHYTGMAAMRLPALIAWDPTLVLASIVIAVLVSAVALWFAFRFGKAAGGSWTWHKVGSAVLMGLAIPAMHYTGMAAARFEPWTGVVDRSDTIAMTELGANAIAAGALVILVIGIGASFVSRYREEQLSASEVRYRMLADRLADAQAIAHVGSWEWHIASGRVTWSAELYRMFGVPSDAPASYEAFQMLVHPEDRDRVARIIARGLADRVTVDYEWRLVRPDGDVRHMLGRNVTLVDERGVAEGLAGTNLDVTERKRAEEAVAQSEAYHRALIDQALDIITIIDANAVMRYLSPSVERVLGYSSAELVGQRAFDFLHPDDLEATLRVFTEGVETPGALRTLEYRFRHKDGSWRYLEGVGRNLLDDPLIQAVVVNARDVSERKAAEENQRTLLHELQAALAEVKTLRGMIRICATCKRVLSDEGSWEQFESYVRGHSDVEFNHGICPDCAAEWQRIPGAS